MAEKKMIIDGVSCPFTTERNVLEVARNNGIDIPSLCYCENLSIYGGCRLCLVENERGAMDAACSMQPRDGMVVTTHLNIADLCIKRTSEHQLFVRADTCGPAFVQHKDLIGAADGAYALGYHYNSRVRILLADC